MDCARFRDLWHARCDGIAPQVDPAKMDRHAETCATCAAWRRQMEAITDSLGSLRDLSEREVNAARPALQNAPDRRTAWPHAARIAAAVVLALGAGAYFRSFRSVAPESLTPHAGDASRFAAIEPTVVLTGATAADYVPMHVKSSQPHVHVYLLFPVVDAQSREDRSAAPAAQASFASGIEWKPTRSDLLTGDLP